jgi:hypothetical protein
MIAHVVLFTPRASLTVHEREELILALERACLDIPQIRRVRIGRRRRLGCANDTMAPVDFQFAAILEFDTEGDLRAYLDHPSHDALGQRFTTAAEVAIAHDFDIVEAAGIRTLATPHDVPGGTTGTDPGG